LLEPAYATLSGVRLGASNRVITNYGLAWRKIAGPTPNRCARGMIEGRACSVAKRIARGRQYLSAEDRLE
jgi:hypothetical protein